MPRVSVLIPAFRPDYLDLSLASALCQTYRDMEVIVGDDSRGTEIRSIVERWADPRVRYLVNPASQQPGTNRDMLLAAANGEYLKFLFDDDFLYPSSVELLVAGADRLAGALVFHERQFVDAHGRPLPTARVLQPGQVARFSSTGLLEALVGGIFNFIGEPSNVLVRAEALAGIAQPFAIDGERMRFLTDVALYTNFAVQDLPIIGIGHVSSAFRRHATQNSAPGAPIFSAGLFEWELVARWCADQGKIRPELATAAIAAVRDLYLPHVEHYGELAGFLELGTGAGTAGRFYSPEYRRALASARAQVDERCMARQNAA
jgi:glycosyltransferase involved in cell wall biosynthesis